MANKPLTYESERTLAIRAEMQASNRFTATWRSMYSSDFCGVGVGGRGGRPATAASALSA